MVPSKIHSFKKTFHSDITTLNFFELEILQEALFTLLNLLGKFYFHTWQVDFHDGWISSWEILDLCRRIRSTVAEADPSKQHLRSWQISNIQEVDKLDMRVVLQGD